MMEASTISPHNNNAQSSSLSSSIRKSNFNQIPMNSNPDFENEEPIAIDEEVIDAAYKLKLKKRNELLQRIQNVKSKRATIHKQNQSLAQLKTLWVHRHHQAVLERTLALSDYKRQQNSYQVLQADYQKLVKVNVLQDVPLEVQDVAFGGLCSGLAVLTPDQKRSGALVIDLGGGTTDYLVYAGNVLAAAGSIGVGGDHVTNDIALGFNIPISRAEKLKREHGAAVIEDDVGDQRVSLPREVGFPERSISTKALQMVINARMDETLRMVRTRLHEQRLLHHVAAGVLITGGGAYLRGLPDLATRVFGLPCSLGIPRGIQGLDAAGDPAAYATSCGLILYALKTYQETSMLTPIRNWIKGVFRR